MKFSLNTGFSRLALLAFVGMFLLTFGGSLASAAGGAPDCASWPLCLPGSVEGAGQLFHRVSAGLTAVLMLALLFEAWRTQRGDHLLLPLTTLAVVLFFAEAYIGAVQVVRGFPAQLATMHTLTAMAAWVAMLVLVVAAGLLARPGVSYPPLDLPQRLKDFLTLTKPVIVLLLLVTTFAGMVTGGKAWPAWDLLFFTLLGGAMAAGGSGAINQYIDRELDRNMQRTAQRPMAAGRMTPAEGLSFGLGLCLVSLTVLAVQVNLLAAVLSLAGMIYYVVLYSLLLKKATVQNIVIGGGAGAIPPMVGWAAATGSLDIPALFLFAIIFMWTPPHFWALALVRRNEYARAGVPMMPVVHGEAETRRQVWWYTLALVGLTLLMPLFGMAGSVYLVSALVFGGGLIYAAWRVLTTDSNKIAWQMYRYSSMYLMFIFVALMVDALV